MHKGLFISLDGVDGAGKSTQCRRLVEWLSARGHAAVACRDPGGTEVGQRIRDILLDRKSEMSVLCEALLYMASRAQLCDEVIRPALERGEIVVSDRYLLANVVYQGHAGGLDPAILWTLGDIATRGLEPDLTLVLDLPVEIALARKNGPADRLESRGIEYLTRVRDGFRAEAHRQAARVRVIDAGQPPDAVAAAIQREVQRVLDAHSRA